ncbi:BRCA1 C terminus domain-containing protein [Tuber brumale]|nr:BRCA1 C terminus domain-containing protein [Tuber brumale]
MGRSQPRLKQLRIDTYNSTSTGHQVGSGISKPASWHRSRNSKLQKQFREATPAILAAAISTASKPGVKEKGEEEEEEDGVGVEVEGRKNIFVGCTIYVNGSTAPLISDVELKRALVANGAAVTTGMSRKRVTHVVLAKPVDGGLGNGGGGGIGGGLAAGKLQKEVLMKKGNGPRYVRVEWVLESIAAEKRLAESKYPVLSFRGGSASLDNMLAKKA